MSTYTDRVPAARWADVIKPGDVLDAIGGHQWQETVKAITPAGDLVLDGPGVTERILYRGNADHVDVIRHGVTKRERTALRRNERYLPYLKALVEGPRVNVDRGTGVTYAAMRDHYGWTESTRTTGGTRWDITEDGRAVLASVAQ